MKYLLHFVGKSTYNEKLFIKEAKRLGVSRALPFPIAKKLYGKLMLLAFKTNEGAKVIGYTIVSGYTLPSSILTEALAKAGINPYEYKVANGSCVIIRGCGSYVVTTRVYVDGENIQKVLEALAEMWKEKKFKVFVNGAFYPIKSFIVKDAKFTRSVTSIELSEELATELKLPSAVIQGVDEYERVLRRNWKEKDKLLAQYEAKTLVSYL